MAGPTLSEGGSPPGPMASGASPSSPSQTDLSQSTSRQTSVEGSTNSTIELPGTIIIQDGLSSPVEQSNSTITLPGSLITAIIDPSKPKPEPPREQCDGDRLSTAQGVGIGIGAGLGGIIVALAAAWSFYYILWPKGHRRSARSEPETMTTTRVVDFGSKRSGAPISHLESLPEGLTDSQYSDQMRDLNVKIANLTSNFFRQRYIQISADVDERLSNLAGVPFHKSSWASVFVNKDLRSKAIRLLVARLLFARIEPSSSIDTTLLPPQLLANYQSLQEGVKLASRREDRINHEGNLTIWRAISAEYFPAASAMEHARSKVDVIAAELAPLQPERQDSFRRMLESVVKDAASLGLDLFKSQHNWNIIWNTPGDVARHVLFPGLEFIRKDGYVDQVNEEGRGATPVRVFDPQSD